MENTKQYKIIISGEETFLEYKDISINKLISINVKKNIVKLEKPEILQKSIIYKVINSQAILGIININNLHFVLHVKSSKIVGKIKNEIIYRIEEVEFCPMQNVDLLNDEQKKLDQLKDGITNLLKLGFYFSFGFNLTNSQQNQGKISYNKKIHSSNNFEQKMKYIYHTTKKKIFL